MPDILTFLQRPDGTIVSAGLATYQDGRVVTPVTTTTSPSVAARTTIARVALSYFYTAADGSLVFTLFPPGWATAELMGSAKLVQRFAVHLLTQKGSIRYRPKQGCIFYGQVQNGPMASESDVFAAFAASLRDIRTNMRAEELATDPDNERFSFAKITAVTIARGSVTATITVRSLDGVNTGLIVPLPVRV